jgi:oligo-1,6-glucosidase
VKQPDLNWENPEVRTAVYEMMSWWLDRGVDGFRMDVINMISKDTSLPDGSTLHGGLYGDGSASFLCGPRIHEFLHEMNQAVFSGRPDVLLTVGEMPGVTVEDAVLFTDPQRREVDMVFQFEHVSLDSGPGGKWDVKPLRLVDLKASLGRWQAGLASIGWNSLYWDNHDQPRAVSRFGDDGEFRVQSAKLLATILHLHRGTPYIYQGEELGMTNVPFGGPADFRDIESVNHFAVATAAGDDPDAVLAALRVRSRDNARTPMQWDGSPGAGFSTGTPWIAVNPNYPQINAAAQSGDPDSVLAHYRSVIDLRHTDPVVAYGDFTMLLPTDDRVYAFTRSWRGSTLLVLGNFSGEQVPAPVPDAADWAGAEFVLGNYPPEAAPAVPGSIVLRPWESRIYRRTD